MDIIEEFKNYIEDFIEKPHKELGGMPICPFARKARVEDKIKFIIAPLDESILSHCQWFLEQDHYEVLTIIDSDRSKEEVEKLAKWLEERVELVIIGSHPESDMKIGNLYTRRDPYPNIQATKIDQVEFASEMLRKTDYYRNWTKENLDAIQLPKRSN